MGRVVLRALIVLLVLPALAACCCCGTGTRWVESPEPEPPVVQTAVPPFVPTAPPPPTMRPGGGPVTLGETVEGNLTGSGATEVWRLTVAEPVDVMIDVIAGGFLDPVLEVWAGDEQIARDDDGGGYPNPRLSLSLEAGSYELRVRALSGSGEYTLSVAEMEAPVAQPIAYGETVSGQTTSAMPEAWWEFEGQAGDVVNISMVGLGDFYDTYLDLYSSDGTLLTSNDDSGGTLSAMISLYTLPATDSYRIVARGYGGSVGRYELTLGQFDAAEVTLVYGQTVSGELTPSAPQDDWLFEGAAGDIVNISMVGQGELQDTYLELLGPDGMYLTSDDDSGEGLFAVIGSYPLPQAGTYHVVARGFGGAVGSYELTVTRAKEQTIAYGQSLLDELPAGQRQDYWLFEGGAGDRVSISMVGLGDFQDTYLELYDLDQTLLTSDSDGGKGAFALIEGYVLPYTGTYRIVASGPVGTYDPSCLYYEGLMPPSWCSPTPLDQAGSYRLSLRLVEEQAIAYGQTLAGELTDEAPRGYWSFSGAAGEAIRIAATGQEGFQDTYLELLGPDGALLAQDDDSGDGYAALLDEVMLYQTGSYTIIVRGYGEETGPYRLALSRLTGLEQPIAYGETLSGEIAAGGQRGYWAFEGAAGDVVIISLVGLEGLEDTYLELIGPDGTLLAQDDDGGEGTFALIEGYALPATGTYRIVARGWGGQVGSYELSLTVE